MNLLNELRKRDTMRGLSNQYRFTEELVTNMSRDMRFPTMWYVDQQSLRSACAYAQSDQSPCLSLEYSMNVKLLTEHHLEFLSFKGG